MALSDAVGDSLPEPLWELVALREREPVRESVCDIVDDRVLVMVGDSVRDAVEPCEPLPVRVLEAVALCVPLWLRVSA